MPDIDEFAADELGKLKSKFIYRAPKQVERLSGSHIIYNGKRLISFSCNDYLGLSQHIAVKEAAAQAAKLFGVGAGASRFVTGNHVLYEILEAKLADFKGTQAACIFGSGYLANLGIIPAFVEKSDLVITDKLIHSCLVDGAILSGAKILRFPHNNMAKCEEILIKHRDNYRHALIITDGVFSMDGDLAPLDTLSELASKYNAWLLCDDAHGLGVLAEGKGTSFNTDGTKINIDLQMGTLSKAIGSYGGYICASNKVIDYIKNTARSLIFSTGLPPMVLASAIAALNIIMTDKDLVAKPLQKAKLFTNLLGMKEALSSIVPIIIGNAEEAVKASEELMEEGFYVSAIRPPTVPKNTSRLRFTFSAMHKNEDIEKLAGIIKKSRWFTLKNLT